jgi:hypothetical protein
MAGNSNSKKMVKQIKKYTYGVSQFLKPTPRNIARFGWALFTTCSAAAGTFVYFEQEKVGMVIGIIGVIGLFLSNFFGHGNTSKEENIY